MFLASKIVKSVFFYLGTDHQCWGLSLEIGVVRSPYSMCLSLLYSQDIYVQTQIFTEFLLPSHI